MANNEHGSNFVVNNEVTVASKCCKNKCMIWKRFLQLLKIDF